MDATSREQPDEMRVVGKALAEPLFPEEDPATGSSQDADHWLEIYTRLIAFKDHVIATMQAATAALPDEAKTEGRNDIQAMTDQRHRYAGRQAFWKYRAADLKGINLDGKSRVLRFDGKSVSLTQREADLIDVLLTYPGQPISTRRLRDEAYRGQILSEEQVRVHISNIRRKLNGFSGITIESLAGKGYRLRLPSASH